MNQLATETAPTVAQVILFSIGILFSFKSVTFDFLKNSQSLIIHFSLPGKQHLLHQFVAIPESHVSHEKSVIIL